MENKEKQIFYNMAVKAHRAGISGVKASALVTLLYLLSQSDDHWVVDNVSQTKIAKETEQALSSVEKHIRFLKRRKLITIEKVEDTSCGLRNRYHLKQIGSQFYKSS